MSAFVAEVSQEQNNPLSHSGKTPPRGQNHDRMQSQEPIMAGSQASPGDGEVEVTVLQRMSSATLGSLVTAILGIVAATLVQRLKANQLYSHAARCCTGTITIASSDPILERRPLRSTHFLVPKATSQSRRNSMLQRGLLDWRQRPVLSGNSITVSQHVGHLTKS